MDKKLKPNTTKYKNEFARSQYDRFSLMLPKGTKSEIKKYADQLGMSVNAFIKEAIREKMERTGGDL